MLEFDGETKTLRPTNKPFYTNQVMQILSFLVSQGGSATKKAVGEALGLKGEAARKAIERAEKAGAVSVNGDLVTAIQAVPQGAGSPTPFAQS
jgi:predicted ArsR family transcriptional regulator